MKHAPSVFGIVFCILLLVFSTPAINAAREGLELWWAVVMPALFPFFVCATLLQKSGALYRASLLLARTGEKQKQPRYALPVFLISAVSGYPASARLCAMLREENALSGPEAERLTVTCSLCSPMFLLGALCTGMLAAPQLFPLLLAAHYAGAVICFFLYPRLFPGAKGAAAPRLAPPAPAPFLWALPVAIADGMWSLLKVCGTIVFFMVLSACCEGLASFLIPTVGEGSPASALFLGLLEMTGGCHRLAQSALSLRITASLCCGLISFGGLSVLMQVLSFFRLEHPLRYLFVKAIHGLLAGLICYLLLPLLPQSISVFSANTTQCAQNALTGAALLFASSLSMAVALLMAVFACGIIKKRAGRPPAL